MKVCPTCNCLYCSEIAVCPKDGSPLDLLREWRAGDSVSERFCVVEKIGHGSMGPVFKARLLPHGGVRVLKPLALQLAGDEFLVKHFRRTIHAASALRHLHLVHVESLERSADGRPFIVMEYAPGLSLSELIARGGFIPALDVVKIATQICAVLHSAHRLEMIHQNLKPDNVIVAEEHDGVPRVKVREFGMADLREAAAERGKPVGDVVMMDHGAVVGTFEYMSPEQAAGTPSRLLDGRTDLYSLGVMMFEALTGELPIYADDPASVLHRMVTTAKKELLCNTVMMALRKDRDYRYSSAAEMAVALRDVADSVVDRTSEEVGFDPRSGAVNGWVSPGASQPRIEDVHPEPVTSVGEPRFELITPGVPEHVPKVRDKSGLRAAAASTDWEIDEVRKSLTQVREEALERRTQGRLLRTSLATVGVVIVALLVFWVVYRGPGLFSGLEGEGTEQQVGPEHQSAPARDATSDVGLQDINSLPVEPPPHSQAPPTLKQGDYPSQAEASGDEGALQAPSPPKERLDRQKPESAADVRVAGEQVGLPTKVRERPTPNQSSSTREAEVKQKITIGWFFVERKDYRAAIERFTEALEIDPSNLEAQAALRVARYASQNPDVEVLPSNPPSVGDGGTKRVK